MGDVLGTVDLVGDHHESDRELVVVDRPVERPGIRLRSCLAHRRANRADKPSLSRRHGESLDLVPVRVGDRPQGNHRG
jgi:hypothetical protein